MRMAFLLERGVRLSLIASISPVRCWYGPISIQPQFTEEFLSRIAAVGALMVVMT